jgi:hypothetical protein
MLFIKNNPKKSWSFFLRFFGNLNHEWAQIVLSGEQFPYQMFDLGKLHP